MDFDSFTSSANLAANEDFEVVTATLYVDYKINDNLSFSSITSMLDGDYSRFDDDEGPEGGDAFRGRNAEEKNWAQEFRFSYNSDDLKGIIGVYYTGDDLVNNTIGLVNILPMDVGVPAQLLPFYPAVVEIDVFTPFEQDISNYAFLTEWDYSVNEKLTVSAGFRRARAF